MAFLESFGLREYKIYACGGAFIGWIILAITVSFIFKPYLHPLSLYHAVTVDPTIPAPSICNRSNSRSDVYELIGDIRIQGSSSTVFVDAPINPSEFTIKPYARKPDTYAMSLVTALTIKHRSPAPPPGYHISAWAPPAVVFSTGGYAGNHFHAFTDVLLPLYATSARFRRDVVFLALDGPPSWARKYKNILDELSRHGVVAVSARDERALCFRRATIGLAAGREFTEDGPGFTRMVRRAYSLPRGSLGGPPGRSPPRMLIVRRRKRRVVNRAAVADVARAVGFEVADVAMTDDVAEAAGLVNSFDVMVGVHGAGLTNMVFLPEKAVVVQIVPFGLEWLARSCFEVPARSMNLKYLAYRAGLNESSLMGSKEVRGNYTDPESIKRLGFVAFRDIYLDHQNLHMDVVRFRGTLLEAWDLLHA